METTTYPKIDGHRKIYVRVPVQVTAKHLLTQRYHNIPAVPLIKGKWMAVNVMPKGYSCLISPMLFEDEADCQKACDSSNRLHGFTPEDVVRIVSKSMGLKLV
jgi:hypothetical protein